MNLMPTDIKPQVLQILQNARNPSGNNHPYLTAFQIFERLDSSIKNRLVQERKSIGGQGAGVYYAAVSVVSDSAELLSDIDVVPFIDTKGIQVEINGSLIVPGAPYCGLYRLK